jgi:isoleucyl-tRNA synthetase
MAPVLTFLSEEVSDFYQTDKKESIHVQSFTASQNVWEIVSKSRRPEYIGVIEGRLRASDPQTMMLPVIIIGWLNLLEKMRPELLKAIEVKREVGLVKHSLEAKVTIYIDESHEQGKALKDFMKYVGEREDVGRFFKDFIIVSQVEFATKPQGLEKTLDWLHVKVDHADGTKCPRCWQWDTTDHGDGLCARCQKVLGG